MSTNSHLDRPLQRTHRGKLASRSSFTSSPQHSETYNPGSFTSCPVFFIFTPSLPIVVLTSMHTEHQTIPGDGAPSDSRRLRPASLACMSAAATQWYSDGR